MTGLPVHLRPDIFVTGETEGGLRSFQAMANIGGSGVDGVAGVTGNVHRLVLAHIPEGQHLGAIVATQAHGRLFGGISLFIKGYDTSFSPTLGHVLAARTMA